jgi:hypothetical protein
MEISVKNHSVFLLHLGLSFLIPFLIVIVFYDFGAPSYSGRSISTFFGLLFFFTCGIPLFIIFFFPFTGIFFLLQIIMPILLRLTILVGFVSLHKKNKNVGIIIDIIFIVINTLFGFFWMFMSRQ